MNGSSTLYTQYYVTHVGRSTTNKVYSDAEQYICGWLIATARITNITTISSRAEFPSVMILLNWFRLLLFCLGKSVNVGIHISVLTERIRNMNDCGSLNFIAIGKWLPFELAASH